MNHEQLDLIPDNLLAPQRTGANGLIEWLHARGWQMSLTELHEERIRRGMARGRR